MTKHGHHKMIDHFFIMTSRQTTILASDVIISLILNILINKLNTKAIKTASRNNNMIDAGIHYINSHQVSRQVTCRLIGGDNPNATLTEVNNINLCSGGYGNIIYTKHKLKLSLF
jgi:hypothetical protein